MDLRNISITIREIISADNKELAVIIRNSLTEFGAAKPGTVYYDNTTDHLSTVFQAEGSTYFVVLANGIVMGGAGIYPTDGLPGKTCELVKFYLAPGARGAGIGKHLMQICELKAAELGYTSIYLETMLELTIAIPLYEKMGYQFLEGPLGNSGHSGCDIWMIKKLT